MDVLIILAVMLSFFTVAITSYGVAMVTYYKLILKSKKSIGQILSEI